MVSVKELLKKALLEKSKEEQNKYQGMLRVSELSQCPVKAVWSFLGEEPQVDEEKLPILAIGSNLHEMLQGFLPVEEAEKEFVRKHGDYQIVGHIDGIMTDPETGEKFIVEFKTIADKVYRNGKTTKDYLPSSHHILQAHFYMRMTGLEKAKIVYLLKSSGEIVEFDVDYDPEVEQEMLKVLDEAVSILKGNKEVVDIYNESQSVSENWKCKYCFYSHLCEKGKSEKVLDELEYM